MLCWFRDDQQSWYCPASLWVLPAAARPCCFYWVISPLFWITGLCNYQFPSSCCEPAAVWGAVGLTAPPKLPSRTSCSPIAFWTGKTPGFSTCSSCLPTPMPAIHHTLPYNPVSTTIHSSSFEIMHHPLTQRKRKLAKILKLCVPGSFFLRAQ